MALSYNNMFLWILKKAALDKLVRFVVLSFLISGLMNCAYWPPPATGGYATHLPLRLRYLSLDPRAPFHKHMRTFFHLTKQLHLLHHSQVGRCYPARLKQMTYLSQQIIEETAAGLLLSAEIDILLLKNNVAAVWNYRDVKGCPRLKQNKHWLRLLSRIQ